MTYQRALMALAAALACAPAAFAGTITAELNRTEGEIGEAFVLTVSIEGSRDTDPQPPQVMGLVINQQGVSESTVYSNGHRVSELQLTYVVYPQQVGDFTIPSLSLTLDGKAESTLPLTLKIHGAGQGGQAGGAAGQGGAGGGQPGGAGGGGAGGGQPGGAGGGGAGGGQPGGAGGGGAGGGQPGGAGGGGAGGGQAGGAGGASGQGGAGNAHATKLEDTGGVFIERECDKASPYVGEQVICAVRVYHRGNLNGGQRESIATPDFRRFSAEGEKRYQKLVNGQRYGVIELKEIVVPTKAGTLELPPFTIDARILTYTKRGNPLDKFFDKFGGGVFNFDLNFTEEKNVTVRSEQTTFNVKPLPEAGKPPGFAGLVGQFKLDASVSRRQVPAGETVTVTATLTGDGLSDTLPDLPVDLSRIGKVYTDKPEYKEQVSPDTGIHSLRVYKLAIVPAKPGTAELGKIEIAAFDPKAQTYVNLSADLGQIIVEPGKAEEKPLVLGQSTTPGVGREDVKELGKDLLGPHVGPELTSQQTITTSTRIILTALGSGPMALAFLAFGFTGWQRRRGRNPEALRRAHAYRAFKETTQAASTAIAGGQVAAGLTQAYHAFKEYLGAKSGRSGSALAAREVDAALAALSTDIGARTRAAELIAMLEGVEFGGRLPPADEAGRLVAGLVDVVSQVEKA